MAKNPRSLTHTLVDELGQAIVCGTYSKENPFPIEAQLCTQYDVSRSILREAVKMLTSKGLLGARPRQGTWIEPEEKWNLLDPHVLEWLVNRKLSIQLLIEFTEKRRVIEPQAAEYAAKRATAEEIDRIDEGVRRMEAAVRGDEDPLLAMIAYHVAVLEASGNRFFRQLTEFTKTALKMHNRFAQYHSGTQIQNIEDCKKIARAIRERNPHAAHRYMSILLDESMNHMYAVQTEKEAV